MNHPISSFAAKVLSAVISVAVFGTMFSSACGMTKSLDRATAEKLIAASSEFRQPAVLPLNNSLETDPFGLDKGSGSEEIEEAAPRYLERFLAYYPQIALAQHLGLASIEQQFLKEEKAVGRQVPAQWFFTVKARPSEQGRSLWKEFDATASDIALPLARREEIRIAGITAGGENQAQADFTWRWKSNALGLALQENTDKFKALPAEIQAGLRGRTEANRKQLTQDLTGERPGRALFRRYDDGWRLSSIAFE